MLRSKQSVDENALTLKERQNGRSKNVDGFIQHQLPKSIGEEFWVTGE